MPRKFEPDRHCGAPKKDGSPCTQPKGFGTDHPGEGCCRLHDDAPPKPKPAPPDPTDTGRSLTTNAHQSRPLNQNARSHGLYARVLTGAAAARFEAVQQFAPGDILKESFCLVHSRALGLLEGEAKFDRQSQIVLDACQVLLEDGQLDEDFVEELRYRLLNLDIEKLARIMNSTISMANAATYLNKMGSVERQLAIVMGYLRRSVGLTSDRAVRELALNTIQELKLEAGLPVEEINELLRSLNTKPDEDFED